MNQNQQDPAFTQASRTTLVEKLVDGIVGTVISNGGSRTVFSDPIQHGDRTVIPVARMTYRFGFGGGSGTGPQVGGAGPVPGGDGGGGGGMLNARPVGYIETGSDGSRFVPVIDWSQILTSTVTFVGAGLLIVLWGTQSRRTKG